MTWQWPWQRAPSAEPFRWLVVDVETSGLDPQAAELLAIAGVAIDVQQARPQIHLHDSFQVFLRPRSPVHDKGNILLHGIGLQAQREATEPAEALRAFQHWAGQAPLMGFHSGFDETLLNRACSIAGMGKLTNPWLDLAPVVRELFKAERPLALDDWLERFEIRCTSRHQAAADALATAQLGLVALREWQARGQSLAFAQLQRMAQDAVWLHGAP